MIEEALESMVTHLVQCTCNGTIHCPKTCNNELVQHEELALKQPISAICTSDVQNKRFMSWNSILRGLLSQCTQLSGFGRERINASPLMNWQQIQNRKVLAPLALKQNADNIIAGNLDMKRKRISDLDNSSWTPPNKIPKLEFSKDNLKRCRVNLKRTSVRNLILQYKCVSKTPFVKLFDVLKEIPQEKEPEKPVDQNQFMNFFGLQNRERNDDKFVSEVKTSHPIKLTRTVSIPISSIYGRTLLTRERHSLPEEAALKKIERTEWYLKATRTKTQTGFSPPVTYDKKPKYSRNYEFPKKQFHQRHRSLKREFLEYLCKPVCVQLRHIDVSDGTSQDQQSTDVITIEDDDIITISDDDDEVTVSENVTDHRDNASSDYSTHSDVRDWCCGLCSVLNDSVTHKNGVRRSCRLACSSLL